MIWVTKENKRNDYWLNKKVINENQFANVRLIIVSKIERQNVLD